MGKDTDRNERLAMMSQQVQESKEEIERSSRAREVEAIISCAADQRWELLESKITERGLPLPLARKTRYITLTFRMR